MRFATQPSTPTGHARGFTDDPSWASEFGYASTLEVGGRGPRYFRRTPTHPFLLSSRQKPRRYVSLFLFSSFPTPTPFATITAE
jgi:hypothetical protein